MNGTSMPAQIDDVDRLALARIIDDISKDIDDDEGDYQDQLSGAVTDLQISLEENEGSSLKTVDNINAMTLNYVVDVVSEKLKRHEYRGDYGKRLSEAVAKLERLLDSQTHPDYDNNVEIDQESAKVALRELGLLVNHTQDEDPDPLTDDVFRAKNKIEDAINNSQ